MANQPPVRPWFRLASLRPISATPAPEPRPSLVQPTIRTNPASSPPQAQPNPPPPQAQPNPPPPQAQPNPPPPQAQPNPPPPQAQPNPPPPQAQPTLAPTSPTAAPTPQRSGPSSPVQKSPVQTSSMPTSPLQKASVTAFPRVPSPSSSSSSSPAKGITTARGSSPSTKPVVQTSTRSPKVKPITPPPSPLTLPPSQLKINSGIEPKIPLEAESKNVIVQKTIEKPKQWLNGNSGETLKNHNEKQKGNPRRASDLEKSGMQLITIAGENRGVYMELIEPQKKHEFGDKPNYLYKNGNRKTISDNGQSEISSSDEGNANKKEHKINRGRTQSSYPMSAFMNSNVQCVNNSLLYNTSCTHSDPGVRLSLSTKPYGGEGFHLREVVNGKHN